jgi:pyruvate-formate lyase-activating enzyme
MFQFNYFFPFDKMETQPYTNRYFLRKAKALIKSIKPKEDYKLTPQQIEYIKSKL